MKKKVSIKNLKESLSFTDEIEDSFVITDNYELYQKSIIESKFKNRVMENCKYCVCCDEINPDLLTAVHIDLSDNLTDENNSLVLCDTHARKYFEKEFVFLKSGKIKINRKSGTLDERMHLARNLVILKKKYLFEK